MECVTPDDFDSKVLNDERKTIVLFYASWCPYCTNFKPSFEKNYSNNVRKVEALVDEDENPFWDRFDIRAVPTIIAFEKGKIIARRDAKKHVGLTKNDMESMITQLT